MILKKTRKLLYEFRNSLKEIRSQQAELEWAHIFHDTIKDKPWLTNLSISPGRWAANYSFLYILVRILSDHKPEKIIEFGLGETTKVISQFLENDLLSSSHRVIEQDAAWIEIFRKRFTLSERSEVLQLPLSMVKIKGFDVKDYDGINGKIQDNYNLYIVDGPFGSERYSRYHICLLAKRLTPKDEFVIILDDYNRQGEQDTASDLIAFLKENNIKIYTGVYTGNKSQLVIATEKYRFVTSL